MSHRSNNPSADRTWASRVRTDAKKNLGKTDGHIYAIRMPDGCIKIGYTEHPVQRMIEHGKGVQPLALIPGTRTMERLIHATLRDHRVRGHEYYTTEAPVLAVVNHLRAKMGKRPLKFAAKQAA